MACFTQVLKRKKHQAKPYGYASPFLRVFPAWLYLHLSFVTLNFLLSVVRPVSAFLLFPLSVLAINRLTRKESHKNIMLNSRSRRNFQNGSRLFLLQHPQSASILAVAPPTARQTHAYPQKSNRTPKILILSYLT